MTEKTMKQDTGDERREYPVEHIHTRVKRLGGSLYLSSDVDGQDPELLIHTNGEDSVQFTTKTNDGGLLNAVRFSRPKASLLTLRF